MKRNKLFNIKNIISALLVAGSVTLLVGCTVNTNYSAEVSNNGKPIISISNEKKYPEFSKLTVLYNEEDITANVNKEALEEYVYNIYTDKDYENLCVDTMASLYGPDNVPENTVVVIAEYDEAVKAHSYDVSKVYIVAEDDDSYLFEAGCTISLSNDQEESLLKICNVK